MEAGYTIAGSIGRHLNDQLEANTQKSDQISTGVFNMDIKGRELAGGLVCVGLQSEDSREQLSRRK